MRSPEFVGVIRRTQWVPVAVLLGLAAALVVYRTSIAVKVGPAWDSFAFLANAAEYAGRGFGYTEPQRAPLISWLTALVFRVSGRLDGSAIQLVDGALTLVGLGAFYLIMRRRFSKAASALGVVALVVAPPVWAWIGVGYTDFASVAVALVCLGVLINATEKNPWLYVLVVPLVGAAALTRVTALLLVFPLAVWFVLRGRLLRDTAYIAGGAALALLAYLPASQTYADRFGDRLFPFIVSLQIAAEQLSGDRIVTSEPGAASTFVLLIAGMFALTAIAGLLSTLASRALAQPRPRAFRLAVGTGLLLLVAYTQASSGLGLRQAVLAFTVPVLFMLFARRDSANRVNVDVALDAVMVSWFLAVADWYAHNPIQVPRYTIGFIPALIYLTVLGVKLWADQLQASSSERVTADGVRITMAAGAVLVIVIALAADIQTTKRVPDAASAAARETALAVASADPQAARRVIYSDVWPYTSWYLRANARPMPAFEETGAVLHELEKSEATYYVAFGDRGLEPTFTPVSGTGQLRIWKRARAAEAAPRALHLGDSWTNYLENITGYTFYLDSFSGAQGWEGSAFLDAYSPDELAKWPVVTAYDVRWRDRAAAERALAAYVRGGGVLVMDASANFDRVGYSLADAGMFDTQIMRAQSPGDAPIDITEAWREAHPKLPPSIPGRWVDENGGAWFGATYDPLIEGDGFTVLASSAGRPVIAVQELGEGRIYWVGANLVWHAFRSGGDDERALVSAVFDDAFAYASTKRPTR